MDTKQEAKDVLVSEFERIFELPNVEAQFELQQLFVTIEAADADEEFLDELEDLIRMELTIERDSEKYRTALDALKRIQ